MTQTANDNPAEKRTWRIFVPLNLRGNTKYRDGEKVEILGPDPKNDARVLISRGAGPEPVLKEFVYES